MQSNLRSVLDKFAKLPNQRIAVHILGSITVDCMTTHESTEAKIRQPELGGSAYRVLDAWVRIAEQKAVRDRFTFHLHAKRPLPGSAPPEWEVWNAVFEWLLRRSPYAADLEKTLSPVEGFPVPVSIHVSKPDGTRDRHQCDDPANQLSWENEGLKRLLEEPGPGILYLGGVWRSRLHEGLAHCLETLQGKGWIITLHPGEFESPSAGLLQSLREAMPFIDILFAGPLALLLLGTEKTVDVALLKQQCPSALDYVATHRLGISTIPPIIVLHQGFLSVEALVMDPATIFRLPCPSVLGEPIHTPLGLRSAFIAAFLLVLCDKARAADDQPAVAVQKCLRQADVDALELHQRGNVIAPEPTPNPVAASVALIADDLVGNSPAMQRVREQVAKVATTDSTVVIVGETGTGKEVVARAIHKHSGRRDKPFVAVNCAAIPTTLAESELFGYEKGAFTGAEAARPGKFELADDGTLLLDEIGDLSLECQAKLLRVLEERMVNRVGGSEPIRTNARVLAATDQDLAELVREGKFREALYGRLEVWWIHVPPLRDRREDIPALARHFLASEARDRGLEITEEAAAALLSPAAIQELQKHDWPRNVRQLRNVIKRLADERKDERAWSRPIGKEDVVKAVEVGLVMGDLGPRTLLTRGHVDKAPHDLPADEHTSIRTEIERKFNFTFWPDEWKIIRKLIANPHLRFAHKDLILPGVITEARYRRHFKGRLLKSDKKGAGAMIVATDALKAVLRLQERP